MLRALPIMERVLGLEHPEVATLYHNLGGLEHARGRFAALSVGAADEQNIAARLEGGVFALVDRRRKTRLTAERIGHDQRGLFFGQPQDQKAIAGNLPVPVPQ